MTPDGTSMFFYQSSAPTHWVKSTSHNDKMLRVVTGNGGGSGGSISFTTFTGRSFTFPYSSNSSTDNHTLSSNRIPSHTHASEGTALQQFPQNPNGTYNGGDVNRGPGGREVLILLVEFLDLHNITIRSVHLVRVQVFRVISMFSILISFSATSILTHNK